jgi:uncharacterized lipoprotein YddW (UPF0748 family)
MTDYLGRIGRTVKEAKPGCLVSMAPTPFPTGRRELMQDSDRWMRKGLVDFLHPQLYRSDAAAYKRDHDEGMVTYLASQASPWDQLHCQR